MSLNTYRLLCAAVVVLALYNLLFNLSSSQVQIWDEARHGVSAYEMLHNGEYLVTTYDEQPDFWYLKPPLGLWIIAASYRLLGPNLFALRIASAMSALLTILLVMRIGLRHGRLQSVLSGLILTTSFAFILKHSGRSGDFDAMLCLITAIIYVVAMRQDRLAPALAGLLIGVAFLLKSFAFVIPLGVYFSARWFIGDRRRFLPEAALCAAVFLVPVLAWAGLRYAQDGSYFFRRMVAYDVIQRGTQEIEGHSGGVFYHVVNFVDFQWTWLAALAFTAVPALKSRRLRGLVKTHAPLLLWFIVPFAIATVVRSKIEWYIVPVYPPAAIIFSLIITNALGRVRRRKALIILLVLIAIAAEQRISHKVLQTGTAPGQLLLLGAELPERSTICSTEWPQDLFFVAKVQKGLRPKLLTHAGAVKGRHFMFDRIAVLDAMPSAKYTVLARNSEYALAVSRGEGSPAH